MDIKEIFLIKEQKHNLIIMLSIKEYMYHMRLKTKSSRNKIQILI